MRLLILIFSFFTLSFLSGCATYTIQSTAIDKTKPLPKGNGIVALQIINNVDRLAPLHKNWTEVIAVRTDNMKAIETAAIEAARKEAQDKGKAFKEEDVDWQYDVYSFSPVYRGTVDSQLFIGSMPAGEYMLSSLYSYYNDGNLISWISMPVFNSAGKFTVADATMTDLGSVVFQALLSVKEASFWRTDSTKSAFVTRVFDEQALGNVVLGNYPNIAQQVAGKETLEWTDDKLVDIRRKLSQLATDNAFANTSILLPNSKQKVLAAKFGILNMLKGDSWQAYNLPTNSQLYSATEIGNKVIVGGELGQLFISEDLSSWTLHSPVDVEEAIIWFGKTQQYSYALTSSAKQYQLYQFSDYDSPWTKVGSFTRKDPNDWLIQNGGLFAFITRSGDVRVINDNKRFDFNETNNSWRQTKTQSLRNMAQLSNGYLVAVEVSQWDGVGSQVVSTDDGNSWNSVNRSLNWFGDDKSDVSLPAVLGSGKVVTLGRAAKTAGSLTKKAKNSSAKKKLMVISSDISDIEKSKSWETHFEAKENCQTLLPALTVDSRVYFLCDQGEIMSTADFGKTWRMDIQRSIAAIQEQYDKFIDEVKAQEANEENPEQSAAE